MLFGINQGGTFPDLRVWHMKEIAALDCDGYAIGGLAVGEPAETMYEILEAVEPYAPKEKPRYLMGVGTPVNILEGVARGIDMFDCVLPARNARHGKLYTWHGTLNIKNEKYKTDRRPIDETCQCPYAGPSPGPICGICLPQGRCWPCVWLFCITCISTTILWRRFAWLWKRTGFLRSTKLTKNS